MILFHEAQNNRYEMAIHQTIIIILLWMSVFAMSRALSATSVATAPTSAPTTEPGDSPRQAYERLVVAMQQGDGQTIRQLIDAPGDERQLVDALVEYAEALARLRQAAVLTYGSAQARGLTGDPADQEKRLEAIRQSQQQIEGDHATLKVNLPDTPLIRLQRVDGRWRVPLRAMLADMDPTQITRQMEETTIQVLAFDETTADILAGKYHTADEAAQSLRSRLIRPATVPTTAATRPG